MPVAPACPTNRSYEFGPFRLDAAERILQCRETAVMLPPKVFDTLAVLVENSGRLLEKDELMRLLWPDSFVEDGSLSRKISYLRKALEEHDPSQKYIETVTKIGYRFVAEVRAVPQELPVNFPVAAESFVMHGNGNGTHKPANPPASEAQEIQPTRPLAGWTGRSVIAAAAGLIGLVCLAFVFSGQRAATPTPFQQRQTLQLTNTGRAYRQTLSPDGKYLAYAMQEETGQSLWAQQTATGSNLQLIPTAAGAYRSLTFSPDGNYLYFTKPGQTAPLFRIPAIGGQPVKLLDDVGSAPALSPDGKQMAFVRRDSGKGESTLLLARADGGGERSLAVRKLPNRFSHDGLSWSPDGRHLAVGVEDSTPEQRRMRVVAVQVADGKEIAVGAQHWYRVEQVAWTGDGKGVIAIAWDPPTGIFSGQLWHLSWPAGEAQRLTNDLNDYEGVSLSTDGSTLATIQETRTSYFWVEPAGQAGRAIPGLSAIGDTQSPHLGIAWLADGRIVYGKTVGGNADLWAMDLAGGNQQRLTTNPEADIQPATSADGRTIVYTAFHRNHPHIWGMDADRKDADGKNARQLTAGHDETMPALSADGRWLFYLSSGRRDGNLRKLSLAGGAPEQVGHYVVSRPALSPDGKWVAGFMADPANDARTQLTVLAVDGNTPPRVFMPRSFFEQEWMQWSPDSRSIYYLDQKDGVTNLRSQPLDGGPSVPLTHFQTDLIFRFALSPDGRTLICERGSKARDIVFFKAVPPVS